MYNYYSNNQDINIYCVYNYGIIIDHYNYNIATICDHLGQVSYSSYTLSITTRDQMII